MPESVWSFRPTPEVRTFAQIIGHLADANLYEHYGNLVTYMRINKIVPPSSEGSGMN